MTPKDLSPNLEGKVALVTGAGRGIGRAISLALAARGARLVLLSRTESELERVAASIETVGAPAATILRADVSDRDEIAGAAEKLCASFGKVDVLVNNAGVVWPFEPTVEIEIDDWVGSLQVNLIAPVAMTLALLPGMVDQGWGRIVNVSSNVGSEHTVMIRGNAYTSAKTALEAHSLNLAAELDGTGVWVNPFRPGGVDTSIQQWIRDQPATQIGESMHQSMVAWHQSGTLLKPERSASVLMEHLESGASGELWDIPNKPRLVEYQ
jgi:3-oxoacyl-[acyl-carrier protein] reductase